jgi:hypothetical protein
MKRQTIFAHAEFSANEEVDAPGEIAFADGGSDP